jgi:phage terminase large subunit-like protein
VIIIDDLNKNSQEATSAATKRLHLTEWDGTINRRIQPGGTVIMIATRWAEDDLSGALIDRMNEPGYSGPKWEVIEYPAFAEPPDGVDLSDDELTEWTDVLGRKYGEVLDCRFSRIPGRDPADFFTLARAGMDPFAFSCMYQQKPSAREGGMFPPENWQFYDPDELPQLDKEVRVWDLAATEGGGDWSVGTKFGRAGDRFYVTDVRRFRKNAGGVQDVAALDGYTPKVLIEEEKGGSGKSVIESYKRLLVGHTVEAAKAEGDKESRATPYSAEQHKRRVYLPSPGTVSWDVKAFIEEHRKMMGDGRRPRHDDQIDTAAYAMLELLGSGVVEMWVPTATNWGSQNWMTLEPQVDGFMSQAPWR